MFISKEPTRREILENPMHQQNETFEEKGTTPEPKL